VHLYQINGPIRQREGEPIRSDSKQEYQTFLCEQMKIGGKITMNKENEPE
jgi:hypothetical protein